MICDKTSYDTYKDAISAARGISKIKKKSSLHVYKCDDCGKFHLYTAGKNKKSFNQKKIKKQKQLFSPDQYAVNRANYELDKKVKQAAQQMMAVRSIKPMEEIQPTTYKLGDAIAFKNSFPL